MDIRKTEVQVEVEEIASAHSFMPVRIPESLRGERPIDAIHQRLQSHVQKLGGYDARARACPPTKAKVWQGKIERGSRFKLSVDDFVQLLKFFNDPVLLALLAHGHRRCLYDLSGIPASEHSLADLKWTLPRYGALGSLLACDIREASLDGRDCASIKTELAKITKETIVVLRQIILHYDVVRFVSDR